MNKEPYSWYNIAMLEKSCGVILYTNIHGKRHYLMIESKDNVFGFPKGHIEGNETEKECAVRECIEETSINPTLQPFFRKKIQYVLPNGNEKEVVYFVGNYENQVAKHHEGFENFEYVLLPYEQAMSILTFDNLKIVLEEAEKFLRMIV